MNVLICLDYSEASDLVLTESRKFLSNFPDVKIYVHTVKDIGVVAYDQGFDDTIMNLLDTEADELKKKAEDTFGREKVTFSCEMGTPVDSILNCASKIKCDLLIVGTHGRTGLDHAFMGSVAERVLRNSEWNTLVIPVKKKI